MYDIIEAHCYSFRHMVNSDVEHCHVANMCNSCNSTTFRPRRSSSGPKNL